MMGQRFATWLMTTLGVSEALAGDLVEQHRAGRSAWWFWQQAVVALMLTAGVRTVLAFAAAVFVATAVRTLFDTFAPPADYHFRSAVTTYVALGTYLAAGCYGAFQTGRLRLGVSLAMVAHVVGHLLTIGFALALYVTVLTHDLAAFAEFEGTGGFGETLLLPVMMLPFVVVLGLIGAALGYVALRPFGRPRLPL